MRIERTLVIRKDTQMKRNKVQQPAVEMFPDFSDLPLFSGTPVTVDYVEFNPQPVAKPQAVQISFTGRGFGGEVSNEDFDREDEWGWK